MSRSAALLALAALTVAPWFTPASAEDVPLYDPIVGQRGAVTITAGQVRELERMADPELRRQMERDPAVLAQKVRERLLQLSLLQEAKARQWEDRPDVKFRAELARQNAVVESWIAAQVVPDPNFPTDEQIQAAYDANKSKIMTPRQYHLAQIFIAAPSNGAVQNDADALRRINELHAAITKQKGDFAALAKKSSEDKPTAGNGGDLGWLREDALIPPIRAAVAGLAEGGVSEPVRSPEGWHVVKLLGTKPSAPATLAEARDVLVRAMRQERTAQAQRAYIAGLLKDEPIKLNEIEIGKLITK